MNKDTIKFIITSSLLLACVLIPLLTFFAPKGQELLFTAITVSFFTLLFFITDQSSIIQNLQKEILDKLNEPEKITTLFFEYENAWHLKAKITEADLLEYTVHKIGRRFKKDSNGWFTVDRLDGETQGDFKNVLDKYVPPKKEFEFFTY
jgi:hypothetical protein